MKKRVCAYARVSTNSRSQEHSFRFQSNYWNETLGTNTDYEYVGLYADQGISGKFANRRPQFMQMVSAVKGGQIDLVFCKSVQRFARNTEELLSYVREFRDLGVGVIFEKENINTLNNDSDLYLTIAAAVAEDDLDRYGANVSWAMVDKFKKGEPNENGRIYGYQMGKGTKKFTIIPKEAEVIRKIYSLYLEGNSVIDIAKILTKDKIPSPNGEDHWCKSTIARIITNEVYRGDCLLQKTFHVNGKRQYNHGERDQYYVENHHEAIIDDETWNKVQELHERNSNPLLRGSIKKIYPFTKMIVCGCCGKPYKHKISNSKYTPKFSVYLCPSSHDECYSVRVKEDELNDMFISAYNEFVTHRYKGVEEETLYKQIDEIEKEKKELIRLNANGWLPTKAFSDEFDSLRKKEDDIQLKLDRIRLRELSERDFRPIDVFDETKVEKFLSSVVITGITVDFHFYNGVVVTSEIKGTRIYDKDMKRIKEKRIK